jgi:hypothetical protein
MFVVCGLWFVVAPRFEMFAYTQRFRIKEL